MNFYIIKSDISYKSNQRILSINKYYTNSACHWPYVSLWTGLSPAKYDMDRSETEAHIIFWGYPTGP